MVTVKSYFISQNGEGKPYVSLELVGEIEILPSKAGRFYADAKKCKLPTRMDEATARLMIGKVISGTIVKKECTAYEYTIVATGEVITMNHRYEYEP